MPSLQPVSSGTPAKTKPAKKRAKALRVAEPARKRSLFAKQVTVGDLASPKPASGGPLGKIAKAASTDDALRAAIAAGIITPSGKLSSRYR